jgi:hypothetical protein
VIVLPPVFDEFCSLQLIIQNFYQFMKTQSIFSGLLLLLAALADCQKDLAQKSNESANATITLAAALSRCSIKVTTIQWEHGLIKEAWITPTHKAHINR